MKNWKDKKYSFYRAFDGLYDMFEQNKIPDNQANEFRKERKINNANLELLTPKSIQPIKEIENLDSHELKMPLLNLVKS